MNALVKWGGLLLVLAVVGCARTGTVAVTHFSEYSDFWPGPKGGVDLVWARLGLRDAERLNTKLAQYDSVVIDRVFVAVEGEHLTSEQINELVAYTKRALVEKIAPYKRVVNVAENNSLRVTLALSNVDMPNPILAVTSTVLPVGLGISTVAKLTTGKHTNVGGATIELLVSDAQSDQALFAVIDHHQGDKDLGTMVDSLDDAKDAIEFWVARLGNTMHSYP